MASAQLVSIGTSEKHEVGLFQRICKCFAKDNDGLSVIEVNGADVGVAFFLHFSIHALKIDHKEGEDMRIFFLFITWTTISRWCSVSLCPSRSLLRSLQVSPLELHFVARITMVGILSIELGREYSFYVSILWKHRHY